MVNCSLQDCGVVGQTTEQSPLLGGQGLINTVANSHRWSVIIHLTIPLLENIEPHPKLIKAHP